MIYVGIDAASKKHDCYIANDAQSQSGQLITIDNNHVGFEKLKSSILAWMKQSGDDNVRIGLESTGHYSHNILHYLVGSGFDTMLINPLLTNMERKASSVRKTKTDTIDAKSICMFLMRNQEFKPYTLASYHSRSLKSLSRRRLSLVKQMTKHKQELHVLVTTVFPEYLSIFSSLHINVSLEILHKHGTPANIAKARIDGLTNMIRKHSKGHHGKDTAMLIKGLAKNTIGDRDELYALDCKIQQDNAKLARIEQEVETHQKELATVSKQLTVEWRIGKTFRELDELGRKKMFGKVTMAAQDFKEVIRSQRKAFYRAAKFIRSNRRHRKQRQGSGVDQVIYERERF